jgi:hypothetical protein
MWVNYEYAVSYFGEKRLTPSLLIGCLTHIHDFLNRIISTPDEIIDVWIAVILCWRNDPRPATKCGR